MITGWALFRICGYLVGAAFFFALAAMLAPVPGILSKMLAGTMVLLVIICGVFIVLVLAAEAGAPTPWHEAVFNILSFLLGLSGAGLYLVWTRGAAKTEAPDA